MSRHFSPGAIAQTALQQLQPSFGLESRHMPMYTNNLHIPSSSLQRSAGHPKTRYLLLAVHKPYLPHSWRPSLTIPLVKKFEREG